MKKKILTLLLAVLASVGISFAESGQCGDMLYWNLSDGVLTITGYQGEVFGDGVIWDAMDATEYGSKYAAPWYNYRSSIYSIVIQEGITYIGDCAFLGCDHVQTINLPNTLAGIGHSAFKGCSNLTSITIPDGITTIKYGTFAECTKLTSFVIPNSVTTIEAGQIISSVIISEGAFQGCSSLISVTIPNSVTSIGLGAFYDCNSLASIIIPNSVTYLGSYAFEGCSSLVSVTIPSSISTIEGRTFCSCGLTSLVIPNSVTSIGTMAFFNCKNLSSISIGNNVTSIGIQAFSGCSSLVSLTIPSSVVTIEESAFYSCSSLQRIRFSEGLNLIKAGGFMNCSSLRSIILPNSLDSLGWQCFNLCPSMDTILIGENLRGGAPSFPSAKVAIWNAKNANVDGVPCKHLSIGEKVAVLPRSVYNNMTPDTIICYPMYPPAIYPTENAGTSYAKSNTILHLTDTTYISIPCGTLNNYLSTTGWGNYRKNMHERIQSGCTPTARTYYTVTFKDWNGTILKTVQVEEGQSATAPANPTRDGYTFTGWDKDFSSVTSDLIVSALYEQNAPDVTYYTVTFKDWNGTILKTVQVEEGQSATAPTNPTRDGYTFIGWDKDFSNVQSNLIVTAQYQKNETPAETITVQLIASSATSWSTVYLWAWTDNGNVFSSWPGKQINMDANGWYSYTFDSSVKSVSIIWNDGNNQTANIENITTSTCYSLNSTSGKSITCSVINCEEAIVKYTVTFKDWDGTILNTQQVEKGKSATAPANPTQNGYAFIGWDRDFSNVQSDLIVTAQYRKDETPAEAITVRLQALSATSWSKVNLYYWVDGVDGLTWPGITLSKDAQGWYGYTFDSSVKSVNIIWNNGFGDQTVDITDVTESTCYMLNSTTGNNITVSVIGCDADGIEDIHVDSDKPIKVLYDGQILILRGDKTYTLHGQEVR